MRRRGLSTSEWEVAIELAYRAKLAAWWSVQPDVQYIIDPGARRDRRDAVVVGVRSVLSF